MCPTENVSSVDSVLRLCVDSTMRYELQIYALPVSGSINIT